MFWRSWSAVSVTGGGAVEVCAKAAAAKASARREAHRIVDGTAVLQDNQKRFTLGVHGKTSAMREARKLWSIAVLIVAATLVCAQTPGSAAPGTQVWIATWGASQQIPEAQNAMPPDDLRDATVRQIFHLSLGGSALRVHVSNEFGTEALHFTSVHVARPLSPVSAAIDAASDRALKFAGKTDVTVPPG